MYLRLHPVLAFVGVLIPVAGILFLLSASQKMATDVSTLEQFPASTSTQEISVKTEIMAPPPQTSVETIIPPSTKPPKARDISIKSEETTPETKKPIENEVVRIQNPYPFPSYPDAILNDIARLSLVNILCTQSSNSVAKSISGSGVIIDPRGVILTNAHVAQYVLLSQDPRTNISCVIRTGAPASPRWTAEILFIPPVWVEAHAHEIAMSRPLGTGEHDYSLLLITKSLDATPILASFPFLPVDTREAIGFQDDQILVASYPTEFIGNATVQFHLYPVTSITTIKQLLTFASSSADLLSLGGIAGAQGGSSGGTIVNLWGFLIGLISTTSEGDTTATRDLRAITLSYINRDLTTQTQSNLAAILEGNIAAKALDFNTRIAPSLINLYLK